MGSGKRRGRGLAIAGVLLASACGSTATSEVADEAQAPSTFAEVSIPNAGTTELEGHTPRGFAGSGVGLFAGDNLNPNFPNGDGIQIWLSFALPEGVGVPESAVLRSDVLSTRGDVFEALGELQAAPVSFARFGPELFDLEPTGELVTCERGAAGSLTCDVDAAVIAAIESGDTLVQFRLTLEEISDSDGEQDLALFFLTDSNTNEPGIFFLDLS